MTSAPVSSSALNLLDADPFAASDAPPQLAIDLPPPSPLPVAAAESQRPSSADPISPRTKAQTIAALTASRDNAIRIRVWPQLRGHLWSTAVRHQFREKITRQRPDSVVLVDDDARATRDALKLQKPPAPALVEASTANNSTQSNTSATSAAPALDAPSPPSTQPSTPRKEHATPRHHDSHGLSRLQSQPLQQAMPFARNKNSTLYGDEMEKYNASAGEFEPPEHWLRFQPVLSWERFPAIRRLLNKKAWAVFISSFMAVCMCVWFVVIAVLRYTGRGALTAIVILSVFFALSALSWMDRQLTKIVLHEFDCYYLLGHATLFIVSGIIGMSEEFDAIYVAEYFVPLCLILLLGVFMDAIPAENVRARIAYLVWALVVFGHIYILSYFFHPEFAHSTVYWIFKADAARLAYIGVGQIGFFYAAYFLRTLYRKCRGQQREFVMLRLPISTSLLHATVSDSYRAEIAQERPFLRRVVTRNYEKKKLRLVHIRAHNLESFFELSHDPNDTHKPNIDPHTGEVALSSLAIDAMYANFIFRPINPWVWVHKLARKRLWPPLVISFIIVWVVIYFIGWPDRFPALAWVLLFPWIFALFVGMSRYDRSLVWAICHRFEWMLLAVEVIEFIVFGIMAQVNLYSLTNVVTSYIPYVFSFFVVTWMDAAPSFPYRFKVSLVVVFIANAIRLFVINLSNSPNMADESVCFYFCTNARVFALSALFQLTLFHIKYLFQLLRHPKTCIILETNLQYSLKNRQGRLGDAVITGDVAVSPTRSSAAIEFPPLRSSPPDSPSASPAVSSLEVHSPSSRHGSLAHPHSPPHSEHTTPTHHHGRSLGHGTAGKGSSHRRLGSGGSPAAAPGLDRWLSAPAPSSADTAMPAIHEHKRSNFAV